MIRWRAIEHIDLVEIAERATTVLELQIGLSVPITNATGVDNQYIVGPCAYPGAWLTTIQ